MESKIFEEIRENYKEESVGFNWEAVWNQPKRYGIFYPVIGYILSLLAVILIKVGIFMWLFLIGGFLLFWGGIYCVNGIIGDYKELKIQGR